MIVVGGTLSATLLNFRMHDVVLAFSSVVNVFTRVRESPVDTLWG
jgi:flagellar motor component MotA